MKEGSWRGWGQHCQTTFSFLQSPPSKAYRGWKCQFLACVASFAIRALLQIPILTNGIREPDIKPDKDKILHPDGRRSTEGISFPIFLHLHVWCEDVILAMIAIFRLWGQVQDYYHRVTDTEPWYCWATEWTLDQFSFLFMWDKQTFISEPFSFCLFCPLKPKVACLT